MKLAPAPVRRDERSRTATPRGARRPPGDAGAFQADFMRALLDDGDGARGSVAAIARQPGFAVYRNTAIVGCIDALEAGYPTVARCLGPQRFRQAASAYVRVRLPRSPVLLEYGADFPDFLARFEPAAPLDWLAPLAHLDRSWTQAHVAADDPPLDASGLAALAPDALGAARLRPHAAARWHRCEPPHAWALWREHREVPEAIDAPQRVPTTTLAALVVRPGMEVRATAITHAECAFLDACAAARPLAEAAQAALAVDPGTDLACSLARLIRAGAFRASAHRNRTHQENPR